MKARLVEFNANNGKTIKAQSVDVYFASSGEPPTIEVELPMIRGHYRSVSISAKQLLGLMIGRVVDKLHDIPMRKP